MRERIESITLSAFPAELEELILAMPNPDEVWSRMERWLKAASNPAALLSALWESGVAEIAIRVFSASDFLSRILVQNPEFVWLLTQPIELDEAKFFQSGQALLAVCRNTEHKLDRLRLIKQEWDLRLGAAEICNLIEAPAVWRTRSAVADGLIQLGIHTLWPGYALERELSPENPFTIVAYGKLGGRELNYSSDIDLVFVFDDAVSEADEKHLVRFCRVFSRAFEEPMGRGFLYRIDLRLRPFGGVGEAASRFQSVEQYYRQYAEPWERMAMLRSRAVVGEQDRWEILREKTCFSVGFGSWCVPEILKLRERIEQQDDLKRGPGGIRDIEFIVHIGQLLFSIDGCNIIDTLETLVTEGTLDELSGEALRKAYVLLRRAEHLIQIEGNQQSHTIPQDFETMAFHVGPEFFDIPQVRQAVRACYERVLGPLKDSTGDFGEPPATRLDVIKSLAPTLLPQLKSNAALLEQVQSGEIMESRSVRDDLRQDHLRRCLSWALEPSFPLSLHEGLDEWIEAHAPPELTVVAMGSYGAADLGPDSDLDLVLIGPAQTDVTAFLRQLQEAYSIDLRLRPEGNKSLLVVTEEALRTYAMGAMENWERLAMLKARVVVGTASLPPLVFDRLPASFSRLFAIKDRVERERLEEKEKLRHVKLGHGGLDDIDWLLGTCFIGGEHVGHLSTVGKIHHAASLGVINVFEQQDLIEAYHFLIRLRNWISLNGFAKDLVPENPDKLNCLAEAMRLVSANELLKCHQHHTQCIRGYYLQQRERLSS